ncbi:putative bifunctional diguanylate cyclase/phosphodiesterase [Allosaccharopolyspora coralli]|nr:EAL domain-containing protein [Allosaccharopolyspora coralli]
MNREPGTAPALSDEQSRTEFARAWAGTLAAGACLSHSTAEVEQRLREVVDDLAETAPHEWDTAGQRIGRALVEVHAVGGTGLADTLDLLRAWLLEDATDAEALERVFTLVSAVAAAYAAADRESVFAQQETVASALWESMQHAQREREFSERRFREVFTAAPIGVAICELDGSITEVNLAFQDILGRLDDELVGSRMHGLFHADDRDYLAAVYADLVHGGSFRLREPRRLMRGDGDAVWTYLAVSVLYGDDATPRGLITMVEDISELTHLQERLQYQALHDAMTGLPNRQFFRTQLETTLANAAPGSAVTLYHLGLDGFALINDGLGFEVGDTVVRVVAKRLATLASEQGALLARLGGTEFALLVVGDSVQPGVAPFAAHINDVLAEPITVADTGIATSASIGVVTRAVDDEEPADLLWASDVALRWAEDAGKRQWAMFDPDRAPHERTDARLAAMMPGALAAGEFEVLFQPLVSMSDDSLIGVEAQLSWDTVEHGRLDHASCLGLAERSGVTLALRDWLLRSAWEHVGEWQRDGRHVRVIFGLSHNQSQDPDLVAAVRAVVDDADVDPQWLRLCMPVAAVLDEDGEASENVRILQDIGVQPALHGFEASPRELRRVRELPVHAVQISESLVQMVGQQDSGRDSPEFLSIATVVSMVRDEGIPVAVGGVDTEEQAARLSAMGCDVGLGTRFGDAILPWEVPELLSPRSETA